MGFRKYQIAIPHITTNQTVEIQTSTSSRITLHLQKVPAGHVPRSAEHVSPENY
jgi:hypothetical protein